MSTPILVLHIVTDILFVIYLPLVLYFAYNYSRYINHLVLKKRYSFITMLESVCVIIKIMAEFASNTAEMSNTFTSHSLWYGLIVFVSKTSFVIWEWLMTYRCWCIYYDISWTSLHLADSWKCILNEKYMEDDINNKFIIRNRSTMGNPKFIAKYILSVLIIITICWELIPILITIIYPDDIQYIITAELATLPIAVIPYLCLIAIYLIFRKTLFNDLLYIKSELTKIFLFLALVIISFWSYIIYAVAFDKINKYLQIFSRNLSVFFIFLTVTSTTFYVLHKLSHIIKDDNITSKFSPDPQQLSLSQIHSQLKGSKLTEEKKEKEIDIKEIKLMQIFNDEKCFSLFMEHLALELSSECMLSFIEFIQYQQYLYRYHTQEFYLTNSLDTEMNESHTLKLAMFGDVEFSSSYIPQSYIVSQMKIGDMKQYKKCAYQLWQKYIMIDAPLEINVSWELKSHFIELFSDYDEWLNNKEYSVKQLIVLFNDCVDEVFMLMDGSFVRFRTELICHTNINLEKLVY